MESDHGGHLHTRGDGPGCGWREQLVHQCQRDGAGPQQSSRGESDEPDQRCDLHCACPDLSDRECLGHRRSDRSRGVLFAHDILGADTSQPYSFTWSNVAAGSYGVRAVAYNTGGANASSATVTVTVSATNKPPTVTIASPANGATFTAPATIGLAATASDAEGPIAKVEFYSGTTLLSVKTPRHMRTRG